MLGPVAANQLGWIAAEVGRQPWIVYGLLRTSEGLSKAVEASQVLSSIVMFTLIYILLLFVWLFVVDRKIKHGPEETLSMPPKTTKEGLLKAASSYADPAGESMTEAKD